MSFSVLTAYQYALNRGSGAGGEIVSISKNFLPSHLPALIKSAAYKQQIDFS